MKRRAFVTSATVAVGCLCAGCIGTDEDAEERDGEREGNGGVDRNETNEQDEVDDRDEPSATFLGAEFEVLSEESGTRGDGVSILFEEGSLTATVEGSIFGRNSCYTAGLNGSEYNEKEGTLSLRVETFDNSDGREVCNSVITEIGYRAVADFEKELPNEVTVKHDGDKVAEARGRIERDSEHGSGVRNDTEDGNTSE